LGVELPPTSPPDNSNTGQTKGRFGQKFSPYGGSVVITAGNFQQINSYKNNNNKKMMMKKKKRAHSRALGLSMNRMRGNLTSLQNLHSL